MSDNDLIRRGDAFAVVKGLSLLEGDILALPAVTAPDRDTFDAMCAMRNAINEYVPMPSLESDLLRGPENSVFCAVVAEAVITEIKRLRAVTAPQGVDALADELVSEQRIKYEKLCAREYPYAGETERSVYDRTGLPPVALAPAQPALTPTPVDDSLAADPAVKHTLAEALTVPEVKALVAAAQDAREVFEEYGSKAREAIDYMEQVALAALRQIGGE